MALAWAYVSGSLVQVLVFSTAYFVLGGTYRPIFRVRSETIQLLSGRLGPPMLGELIGQSNVLAERFFASFLPPGVISALGYGRRILVALNGLINNSVSVAILPRISQEAVTEDLPKLRETVIFSTKLITFPTGLAAITIVGFSHPLVKLLFERGAFDLLAAKNTAVILSIFAPSIIILGLTQLVMVPFFAFGETKIIFIYRVLFLIVNLILDGILIFFFGGFGLAAALPISLLIVLVIWIITLARRLNGLGTEIYTFLLKFSTILALVLSVVYLIGLYLQTIPDMKQLILWSVGAVALGIIVFLGLSWAGGLFRIKNYMGIISSFTNSLKRQ
jgi:putative peptidoglycan lipid II flippase